MAGIRGWEKTRIKTENGEDVEAVSPVIISASRSTDIPAFHADRFMSHLRRGYTTWTNPFNRKEMYVSFERARVIVFWTKNPRPLIPYLPEIDKKGINYYFQYTVNDYEKEKLEPRLPPLDERIQAFIELSNQVGKERVLWRFDPLILLKGQKPDDLIARVHHIGERLHTFTEKLIFSFVDIDNYPSVKRNLHKKGVEYLPMTKSRMLALAKGIAEVAEEFRLEAATCAEEIDLSGLNISHNKCIDDELMIRLFPDDDQLMDFLGVETGLFPLAGGKQAKGRRNLKDRGQRAACGCILSKDIGQYNTCGHLCVYCYANHSPEKVEKNLLKMRKDGE